MYNAIAGFPRCQVEVNIEYGKDFSLEYTVEFAENARKKHLSHAPTQKLLLWGGEQTFIFNVPLGRDL